MDDGINGFVRQAALLAAQLEQRTAQAVAEQRSAATAMIESARNLDGATRASFQGAQEEISRQAQQALRAGLSAELAQIRAALDEAGTRCQRMMAQLRGEQDALISRTRILTWKLLGFAAATALLLIAGTSFVVWHNIERNRQLNVRAEVTEALQQVTITSCGGRPCIKLDARARRWGKEGEYVLVDPRADERTTRRGK